jgi:hypothetical protein
MMAYSRAVLAIFLRSLVSITLLSSLAQAQVESWHQLSPLPANSADQFWYGKTGGTTWFGGRSIADTYGGDLYYSSGINGEGNLVSTLGWWNGHSLWIGLNDSAVEGTWAWDGGHPCSHSGSGVNTDLRDYVVILSLQGAWHIAIGNEGYRALIKIPPSPDCNQNGVPDSADIVHDPGLDTNNDGQIDACEDCNGNGTPDADDISTGSSSDCDTNGVPDECQIMDNPGLDCDSDMALDDCQVVSNPSLDCDLNGTIDSCEIALDPGLDCNSNGALDSCDLANDPGLDCDENGTLDSCDIASDSSLDQNTNGILDTCECVATNYCLASNNTSGNIATISANGSHSLTLNAFTLEVQGAAIQKFGLFFYGASQAQIFLGEGMLCISAPIQRLQPVLVTDAQGAAALPLDFTMPPFDSGPFTVNPLSTWNFQFWFRDPLGGPAGFNFSDGLEVTFCP